MSSYCITCGDMSTTGFDPSSGTTYCEGCGNVLEESAIVNEITFGETGAGAAIVQGSYVAAGQAGPKRIGPRGRGGTESREVTLANGKRKIWGIANGLSLAERVCDSAQRTYTLAVANQFTRGRRTEYVAAACLYVACRLEKTTHMLIDFSDFLHINVFVLGATYLRLVRELGLGPQLPLIEPSVYISRFAHLLEFGDETQRVAHDAIRLVKRFNRDWMQTGRRPAGMCGAALVLAARMNNFRRSISEVVQVVKIADVTIKKRLEEFKHTASGALSVQEFREVWLEESADPPAYTDGLKKDAAKKKAQLLLANGASSPASSNNAGGAFGELLDDASALPESSTAKGESSKKSKGKRKQQPPVDEMSQEDAEFVDSVINSEIETSLSTKEGAALAAECDELDAERQQQAELNQLNDEELDEEELEWFILSPEEVKEKERLWVEMNKEYLQQVAEKQRLLEGEDRPRKAKVRKRKQPADSSTATHANAADSAKALLQKKQKVSKKLNYAALEGLFDTTPGGEAAQTQREDTADLDYYGTVARKQKAQQHRSESPTAALNGRQHEGGEEEDQQQEEEEEDGVVDVEYDPTAHIADTSQQQPDQEEEPEEEEEEEEEEEPAYDDENFTHDADAFDVDDF